MAVLPCSCFTYTEACDDMKLENWISCHIHAYNYFGGVTRLLVPDNLKTGITKNTRYETVLNRSYQEMAEYYGTAIVPDRVRHPQDKSHAEDGVNFLLLGSSPPCEAGSSSLWRKLRPQLRRNWKN